MESAGDAVHGVLRLQGIVLRRAARDMGPWSNPISCDTRGQSRDAHNLTAMTPGSPASWPSLASEPARILHDPGSMHCDLFSAIPAPRRLLVNILVTARAKTLASRGVRVLMHSRISATGPVPAGPEAR